MLTWCPAHCFTEAPKICGDNIELDGARRSSRKITSTMKVLRQTRAKGPENDNRALLGQSDGINRQHDTVPVHCMAQQNITFGIMH